MNHSQLLRVSTHLESQGQVVVLTVEGEIDLSTAPMLSDEIDTALATSPAGVVVDLTGVDFLASVGMSVLLGSYRNATSVCAFAIVADGTAVRRPMKLVGLDAALPLHSDLATAVESVSVSLSPVTRLPTASLDDEPQQGIA